MTNVLHNIVAAAWSFTVVAGLLSVLAKLWLSQRLSALDHPADFDRRPIFFALVLPGLLPLIWVASELTHLKDSGALVRACCSVLAVSGETWLEWVFGVGAVVLALVQAVSLGRRWRRTHRAHRATSNRACAERVARICAAHSELAERTCPVRVVDCQTHVCATMGLFDQRIEIAASLVDKLDDAALEAALLHEMAHAAVRDPARNVVLLVSQVLNPFAWILSPEVAAWRFAREIACDGMAVRWGAQPVSVAQAIITAARAISNVPRDACAHMCGTQPDALSARVGLLLNDAAPSASDHAMRPRAVGATVFVASAVVPHVLGVWILSFHCLIEQSLHKLVALV